MRIKVTQPKVFHENEPMLELQNCWTNCATCCGTCFIRRKVGQGSLGKRVVPLLEAKNPILTLKRSIFSLMYNCNLTNEAQRFQFRGNKLVNSNGSFRRRKNMCPAVVSHVLSNGLIYMEQVIHVKSRFESRNRIQGKYTVSALKIRVLWNKLVQKPYTCVVSSANAILILCFGISQCRNRILALYRRQIQF